MGVWHELIIAGAEDVSRAFVAGFAAARPAGDDPVFGRDCHLAPESLGERLRALFAHGSHHVLFAPKALAVPLAAGLRARGPAVGLRLERRRTVESMYFEFRVEAFARAVVAKIRRVLVTGLPPGVRLDAFSESTEQDPSVHGVELYSPAHEYIYRASGRIVGQPPRIFDVRQRVAKLDFVTVYELHAKTTAR